VHVLVTGGAGFIGQHVIRALLDAGHQVRALDALIPEAHPNGVRPHLPAEVEFIEGDVGDPATVRAALAGIDAVSHHAALVGRGKEIMESPRYVDCSGRATAVLLTQIVEAGVRFLVHAGSVVIYGDSRYQCAEHGRVRPPRRSTADLDAGRYEPMCPHCGAEVAATAVTEDDVPDPPHNVYAVTKLLQENLIAAWAREVECTAVGLRYHNVYGPGMPYRSPYSGVASVFRSAVAAGDAPRVFEDGAPQRDFVHVKDVALANVAALSAQYKGFRAYNVASGEPRSISQLATALAAEGGAPAPLITGEYRVGDVRHLFASPARIGAELGWRPSVPFDAGVKEFATAPMATDGPNR
jgi:dTDP-L-rhamnose 4-epimerase